MKRAGLALLLCLGWAVAQEPISLPEPRATFEAKAPVDIQLGKLWWDVGLFHPFTGGVSRDQWEKGYFPLMNKAVQPGADLVALTAEAVGLLKDPSSLVLEAGEGRGKYFLPIIWQVKGGKAWIVGGDPSQIREPFGPVDQVGGQPIRDFLARRLGSNASDDRAYSALTLACRRGQPFSMEFGANGVKVSIHAVGSHKDIQNPWIKGGWKGKTILEMDGLTYAAPNGVKALPPLDLRAADWIRATETKNTYTQLERLGVESRPKEVVRLLREHRGQYDEDWDRYAHDSASFNRMMALPSPNRIVSVPGTLTPVVTLPQVVLDTRLAEVLAGWALDPKGNTCARDCQYSFGSGIEIRLRLESWGKSLADAQHQATFANGGLLTVPAAKALSVATMINFDHLFSFTPTKLQEGVFRAALAAKDEALSVPDLVFRSGGITKDAHTTTFLRAPVTDPWALPFKDLLGQPSWVVQPFPFLPLYETSTGELRLLRQIGVGGIPTGTVVESVEKIPLAPLVKKIRPFTWARPEQRDVVSDYSHPAIGGGFGYTRETTDPALPMKGKMMTFVIKGQKLEGDLPAMGIEGLYAPFTPPAGWEIMKRGESAPTVADITHALEAGRNLIIDARDEKCLSIEGGDRLPSPYPTPEHASLRRTPSAPYAWGTDPDDHAEWLRQTDTTFALRGYLQPSPRMSKKLPGRLVIVVCGTSASHLELATTFLKEAFPLNTKVVGLPTAGTMGVRSRLYLPVGGGDNALMYYSPTVSYMVINGHNYSYKGVPLDHEVTEAELLVEMESGSPDCVMSAGLKALGIH